jgi:hypothetical protein
MRREFRRWEKVFDSRGRYAGLISYLLNDERSVEELLGAKK